MEFQQPNLSVELAVGFAMASFRQWSPGRHSTLPSAKAAALEGETVVAQLVRTPPKRLKGVPGFRCPLSQEREFAAAGVSARSKGITCSTGSSCTALQAEREPALWTSAFQLYWAKLSPALAN